jgi:hypothetical protein
MSAFGTKRTSRRAQSMATFGGQADIDPRCPNVRLWPKADMSSSETPEPRFAGLESLL